MALFKIGGAVAVIAIALTILYASMVSPNSPFFNAYIAARIVTSLVTGNRAICGRDGWIFNRMGMRALLLPWIYARHNVEAIAALNRYLEQKGVKLRVVPIPDKAAIVQIRRPFIVDNVNNQRVRMIKMLRKRNVHVIDLASTFMSSDQKNALYQKKDTHWDGPGILIAARVVFDTLNHLLGESAQSSYSFKDTVIYKPRDLAMLLRDSSLYPNACRMIIAQDGNPFKDSVWSDIMIFGDSYTNINHAFGGGIGAQIAYFTHRQTFTISHISNTPQGPSEMLNFLLNRRKAPKIIVWVFISLRMCSCKF